MDNNTKLAQVYSKKEYQLIIILPLVWGHIPDGDWFIKATVDDRHQWTYENRIE